MTDAAVDHARELAERTGVEPVIRVRVIGGGCSGLTWDLTLGDGESMEGDKRRLNSGVDVVVDGVSGRYLLGACIDVSVVVSESGLRPRTSDREDDPEFVLRDLAGEHVCSCGESFSA